MRGVRREDREQVEQLLLEGKPPVEISKQFHIPLSTITTWVKVLRKEKKEKVPFSNDRIKAIYTAKSTNASEARLMNLIAPLLNEDMSESEFMRIENALSKELKQIANELL